MRLIWAIRTGISRFIHANGEAMTRDDPLYTIIIFLLGMLCACGLIWGWNLPAP